MGWIALIADPAMAYGELIPPLMIAGCGISMAIVAASECRGARRVDRRGVGKAAGVNSTLRELGGVFGIAITVAVFAGVGGYASAEPFTDGFASAIGVAAAFGLFGACIGVSVPGHAPQPADPVPGDGGGDVRLRGRATV